MTDTAHTPNPAVALYNRWHDVLDGCGLLEKRANEETWKLTHMFFGKTRHYGIGVVETDSAGRPILAFGQPSWNTIYTKVRLTADGEFMVDHPFGYQQRQIIKDNVPFLDWGHFRGYNWTVDDGITRSSWAQFNDWQNPQHYVSERVMMAQGNYHTRELRPWLKLEPVENHWRIAFARTQKPCDTPEVERGHNVVHQARFDHFEALRIKRYRLAERDHKIATGEIKPVVKNRPEPLTEEEREERAEAALVTIVAHLNVSQPARTKPLRTTPEEEGLWLLNGQP